MSSAARLPPADSFTLLDLGTAQTTLTQIKLNDGGMCYAGHVRVPSQGMRKGQVIAPPAAAEAIRQAAAALEARTGTPVERVFLSLTGTHVKGVGSQASAGLTSRSREVTREDVRRVLDLSRAITLPEGRQILHVIPQEFALDRQDGIHEPVGMLASRIEARVYIITVAGNSKDNLVLAANHAGLAVEQMIFAPLAAAEACLQAQERHAGVAVVDMGAGSTGVVVYLHGSLVHAGVIPIGGDHVTGDIAFGLGTPQTDAEHIKCDYGGVDPLAAAENSEIEAPSAGGQTAPGLSHRRLCEWIEPRARELIRMLQAELERNGVASAGMAGNALGAGLVLCGGGWRLQGFPELLSSTLGLPVRIASPAPLDGMPAEMSEPEYAFSVGACYFAHRLLVRQMRPPTLWDKLRQRWESLAD